MGRTKRQAWVYKRGARWWAGYTDHKGDLRRNTLGPEVTTKAEARDALTDILHREAEIRRGGRPAVDNSATFRELVEAFLIHKAAARSYETAKFYRVALASTVGEFRLPSGSAWPTERREGIAVVKGQDRVWRPGPLGVERVADLSRPRVEEWIAEASATRSARTVQKAVQSLRTLLDWAVASDRIKSNSIRDLAIGGKSTKKAQALAEAQIDALLAASPEPDRTYWLFFLGTGVRKGEFVQLRRGDVDLAFGVVTVRSETTKDREERTIPLIPELRDRLAEILAEPGAPEAPLFATRTGGHMVNNLPRRFYRCVKQALVGSVERRAGVWTMLYREDGRDVAEPLPGVKGWKNAKAELLARRGHIAKGISLHTLRHTFATQALRHGAPIMVVSRLLGHSTVQLTLDIYGHVFPEDKRTAVDCLPFGGTSTAATRAQDAAPAETRTNRAQRPPHISRRRSKTLVG